LIHFYKSFQNLAELFTWSHFAAEYSSNVGPFQLDF